MSRLGSSSHLAVHAVHLGGVVPATAQVVQCRPQGHIPNIFNQNLVKQSRWSSESPPSICVTAYPELKEVNYRDVKTEKEVEFVQKVVAVVRSTRADYNLPNRTKTDIYLEVFDQDTAATLER